MKHYKNVYFQVGLLPFRVEYKIEEVIILDVIYIGLPFFFWQEDESETASMST